MKSIQITEELHARLKALNAKNMDMAILQISTDKDKPGGEEIEATLNRIEARIKNVQDKLAGIERAYAELVGKVR